MISKLKSQQRFIYISQKKHYSKLLTKIDCLKRIFCCKCINCCQDFDFSLLTSQNRKGVFEKMVRKYLKSLKQQQDLVVDPFFIMIALLLGDKSELYVELIEQIVSSKEHYSIFSKEDLQFYMPQLCSYLVFHEQMTNCQLFNLMERACKIDIKFSLKYYFYLKALQVNNGNHHPIVQKYNKELKNTIKNFFKLQLKENQKIEVSESYNNRGPSDTLKKQQKYRQISFNKLYKPIFLDKSLQQTTQGLFESTIQFYYQLLAVSRFLKDSSNRKQQLYQMLRKINTNLPALIKLPFSKRKNNKQYVLGIVYQQCKVFNTKERAPYYICLEVCENDKERKMKSDSKIKSIGNIEYKFKRSNLFQQDAIFSESEDIESIEKKSKQVNEHEKLSGSLATILNTEEYQTKKKSNIWNQLFKLTNKAKDFIIDYDDEKYQDEEDQSTFIFGESESLQMERIKKHSPYSQLAGYGLIHLIVKTNDDLKQQAFAMQLLQQMQRIFQMQKIPLKLTPYQVIPLDYDAGIIQCVKDSITIDQLRKKDGNLKFITRDKKKLKNFVRSLAGYSLVTYLLQVKDRHNGNIMIHKDGRIFHIDYGYFLSNSPGKGVQLQKNVPFKLTLQYVETMGGLNSKYFAEFRKLFYQGYNACRKHQHRLLILTKLMYSCYGKTMPCFVKGNEAIQKLEERFNPIGHRTDGDISLYCQNLINSSVDNWRARWYDKWQYYMQGIFQ